MLIRINYGFFIRLRELKNLGENIKVKNFVKGNGPVPPQ